MTAADHLRALAAETTATAAELRALAASERKHGAALLPARSDEAALEMDARAAALTAGADALELADGAEALETTFVDGIDGPHALDFQGVYPYEPTPEGNRRAAARLLATARELMESSDG